MKKRLAVGLVTATAVFGAVTGLAASLNVSTDQLGSGDTGVSSCDSNGVNTAYTYNANGTITHVTVEGIEDGGALLGQGACDGETVFVELMSDANTVIASATGNAVNDGDVVAVDALNSDDAVTVEIATPPSAAAVDHVRVTITG